MSSQANYFDLGILPSIKIKKQLKNNWFVNYNTEFRQNFVSNFLSDKSVLQYDYIHTDHTFLLSKQKNEMLSFSTGYVLRVENLNNLMHRFLFQIKSNHFQGRIELSNRFRFDTSYQNNYSPIHRIRYKFLVNIPLKRSKVYLKLGNEYVNIFSKRNYNLEIRSILSLLLKIKESKKIEFGLDYRLNSFINRGIIEGNFWFFMSYEIII